MIIVLSLKKRGIDRKPVDRRRSREIYPTLHVRVFFFQFGIIRLNIFQIVNVDILDGYDFYLRLSVRIPAVVMIQGIIYDPAPIGNDPVDVLHLADRRSVT